MELLTVNNSSDFLKDTMKLGTHFIYKGKEYIFSSYSGTIADDYETFKVFNMRGKIIDLKVVTLSAQQSSEDYKLDGEYIQEQKDSHGLEGFIPDTLGEIE